MSSVCCTACGGNAVRNLGPLPEAPPTFGGAPFPRKISPGNLWHCLICNLRFRHPYMSQSELTALYESLPDSVWSTSEDRPFWKNVRTLCEKHAPGRRVLDVGCFTGDFLSRMPPGWVKLGIEPGSAARRVAGTRNVQIVAQSLEAAAANRCRADCVTLLDVIEHFQNPLRCLSQASSLIEAGGCVIILTGNADATAFRILSNNYWYCAIPEHVSFVSRRWFEWAAKRLDMSILDCEYVSGETFRLYPWLRDGIRNTLFASVQRIRTSGRDPAYLRYIPLIRRATKWRYCPWWLTAKDQILIALQKRTVGSSAKQIIRNRELESPKDV
jgi:SAM-dependent methyltransferase